MRTKFWPFLLVLFAMSLTVQTAAAQGSGKQYQQMSITEQSAFVASEARRIARDLSGRDYEFTAGFEADILAAVNSYTRRLKPGAKNDLRGAFERGRANAQVVMAPFRMQSLSPLFGLYIPFIESEFVNIDSPTPMGSLGVFQFIPQTGANYGLSPQDLLDVAKSADAAARFMKDNIDAFKDDPMKEALGVLAYNRGVHKTKRDMKVLINEENKKCSICALNADRSKLDETFRSESVFYVPRFFAAAIVGENPQAFGLQMQPLSSY